MSELTVKYLDVLYHDKESELTEDELMELLSSKEDGADYWVAEQFNKTGKRTKCFLYHEYDGYESPNSYLLSCDMIDKLKRKNLLKERWTEERLEHFELKRK